MIPGRPLICEFCIISDFFTKVIMKKRVKFVLFSNGCEEHIEEIGIQPLKSKRGTRIIRVLIFGNSYSSSNFMKIALSLC